MSLPHRRTDRSVPTSRPLGSGPVRTTGALLGSLGLIVLIGCAGPGEAPVVDEPTASGSPLAPSPGVTPGSAPEPDPSPTGGAEDPAVSGEDRAGEDEVAAGLAESLAVLLPQVADADSEQLPALAGCATTAVYPGLSDADTVQLAQGDLVALPPETLEQITTAVADCGPGGQG